MKRFNLIFASLKLKKFILAICFFISIFFICPSISSAKIQSIQNNSSDEQLRSIETLRDLDYETWQLVLYPKDLNKNDLILRVIGYPGTLRINHPTSLEITSGRKQWLMKDITLANIELQKDTREAAVEFELSPLLQELKNNRPLRFKLEGGFSELPIPPYLVSEWRSLTNMEERGEDN